MDIKLLYFEGCPNWKAADERLAALAAEQPGITVTRHLVDTLEEAERVGFHGSPKYRRGWRRRLCGGRRPDRIVVSQIPDARRARRCADPRSAARGDR